jgi:TolB protein
MKDMCRQSAWLGFAATALVVACVGAPGQRAQSPAGIFEGHEDVGPVLHPGSAEYDAASKAYTIAGSGENMWFAKDEFHFVWKRVSGDFTLTADIAFSDAGGNAHKKAVLMARQSLATDSAYADVAVHGDGLTSLQTREEMDATTHEVGINAAHPRSARLEKRGDYFYMSLAGPNQDLKFAGGSMRVPLKAPFYVGIGVCAHDKGAVTKAVFSNVTFTEEKAKKGGEVQRYSTLETISVASTDRRVVHVDTARIQAPVWTQDDAWLVFDSNGSKFRVASKGGTPERFTEEAAGSSALHEGESYPGSDEFVNCFPRVSPDGLQVAVLSYERGTVGCPADRDVLLRLISSADKKTRVLTRLVGGPGTLGGSPWSSDGKSLVFVSHQAIPQQR